MNINKSHFDWLKIIKEDPELTPYAKYIAFYLSSFMTKERQVAWPSQKRMSYEMGIGLTTIKKHIGILIENGYLVMTKSRDLHNNKWQYNIYEPDIPTKVVDNFIENHSRQPTPLEKVQPSGVECTAASRPNYSRQATTNIQENKQRKIQGPTVDEVRDYCLERSNGIDPQYFLDYYTSNGWMRGKTKIKDWKACVRTWEKNNKTKTVSNEPLVGAFPR